MFDIKKLASERIRRLSKEGVWIVLGQIAAVSGGLVGVRLLTELLSPAAYGELALGMTVAILVNQTVLGPLGNGIARYYAPAAEQGDLGSYLSASRNLVLRASGIIGVLNLVAFIGFLISGHVEWITIACVALIFATLSGYSSILSSIQNAARQRSIVAIHRGLESWMRFIIAAGLLVWLGSSSVVTLVGYGLALLIVLGSQYFFFRKIISYNPGAAHTEKIWQKQIWAFSWPFSIFGVFTWVQLASDRWALGFFSSTQEVGLYAVLFQLGYYPISTVIGMAMDFLAPIFYTRAGDGSDSRRNAIVNNLSWRLIRWSLSLTMAAFFGAYIFHELIFRIFAAEEYRAVSYLLPWVVLAGGVFASGQTIALGLMSRMKTQSMIAPKIVTALLGLTFNFAGAYWYGAMGVVIAGVAFSVSFFVWMMIILNIMNPTNQR